jgi:hypothetical protein
MASESLHRAQVRESSTQRLRSTLVNRGRLTERSRTPSWVAEGKDRDSQLAPGSEEGEAGKNQGAEEVQHGWAAWSGGLSGRAGVFDA